MEHFAGLDVATNESALCVVDETGKVVLETKVATDPAAIADALRPFARTLRRVGHEAGSFSPWLQPELAAMGVPAHCLETRHVRAALEAQRNKMVCPGRVGAPLCEEPASGNARPVANGRYPHVLLWT